MPSALQDDPLLSEVPEVDGFKVLEPCVLYAKLGEGGMGAVYRGRHLNLDIDVAVKCLRRSLADQDASFVQRFQREARLAAGIHHQNLVQVYDVSQKSGVHYLVMEFVSGETARDRVRRKGPLAVNEALRIAFGAAAGLAEAHARKIVHRDVKPDNVLIGRDGSVKVSDLGLAKAMESEVEVSLTQGVMGTPQYMAPEQWEDSSRVTPAADVWALGATIWYLLAGSDPIEKGTFRQVYKRICIDPFPDLRAHCADVPDDVVRLIARCVAREPGARFASCADVLGELRRFVGVDEGELAAKPGEETRLGRSLVSPPPPETLARIRSQFVPGLSSKPPSVPRIPEPAPTLPLRGAPPVKTRSRRALPLALGAGAALLAAGLFFALSGGKDEGTRAAGERSDVAGNSTSERATRTAPRADATPPAPRGDPAADKPPRAPRGDPASAKPPPPPRGDPASAKPASPPRPDPESGERAPAPSRRDDPAPPVTPKVAPPPGCTAVEGEEPVTWAGRLWPRRVVHSATGIRLVLVLPGSFTMGSTVATDGAPRPRKVQLTRAFYMSENEVSEAEYRRVSSKRALTGEGKLPVVGLSAKDADEFCKLAKLELPREAEWEYACRAGKDSPYAFGDSLDASQAATAKQGMVRRECGVSERNAFGLADMHGNAKEFCADLYQAPEEYARLGALDPVGKRGRLRVLRGGSYLSQPELCTSAARGSVDPARAVAEAGLRVILVLH